MVKCDQNKILEMLTEEWNGAHPTQTTFCGCITILVQLFYNCNLFHFFLQKCNRIEANNTQLRYELKKLREEKEKVRKELEDHLKICPFMSHGDPYVPR